MTLKIFSKAAACLLLVLAFANTAEAQFRSAIEGTVTDPGGGIVSEAQVTLVNVETGVSQTAKTNSAGSYGFPTLPPGKYKITVSAKGFASVTQENITLGASETRTISLALKVGDVSETITVTTEPAPLQSSEGKVATNISTTQIRNLPMAGRNILDLVSLAPGVTGVGNLSGQAGGFDIFSLVGEPKVNANGQRGDGNSYYVDGISANSNPDPGTVYVTLNPDSVAEFSVALNDYSAEYGRTGSIVVNAVSKSGSNKFHGSLFEYHRDNKLTARNVFQNTPDPNTGRILPVSRRNEFGFSLGGPIQTDKMFFFGSLDTLRSSEAVTNLITVETPEFVNFLKTRFPNNLSTLLLTKYPVGDIGPIRNAQTVAQYIDDLDDPNIPVCSGAGPSGMPCNMPLRGSAVRSFAPTRNGLQWNARVDRYLNDSKDRIHVNYQRRTADVEGQQLRTEFRNAFAAKPITYYANVNWTHTFNSSVINEAAVGFTRFQGGQECSHCEVPPIGTGGGLSEGFGNGFSPALFIQNDWNWRDVLSVNRGAHSLKFGVEIFRDQENDLFSGPQQRPGYDFLNLFDFAADKPVVEFGVNFDLRDGKTAFQDVQYRVTTFGFFGQDNWKVKKNFSLNLGLRWDFSSNPNEKNGRMSNVILGSGSTFQQRIAGASVKVVPELFETHRIGYFAPRLSFAWTPWGFDSRISVRGGIGVFMNRWPNIAWSDRIRFNPPFQSGITADTRDPAGPQPVYGLCKLDVSPFNCPIPPGLKFGINERGGPIGARAFIGGTSPDLKYAYSINRFFGIQYAFTSNWILEADYLGSQAVHLYTNTDRNRFAGDMSDGKLDRLNPFFGGISYTDNSGWAHYNGATFSLNKRFNKGYTFTTSFTFGKTLSVQDSTGVGRDSLQSPIIDAYNINGQRGLAAFDIAKRLSFNLVYDVPKKLFGSRFANATLGNWQLGVIANFQDGYPFWVTTNQDLNGDGNFFDAPDAAVFGNSKHAGRSDFLKPNGWLRPSDFPSPPCALFDASGACIARRAGTLGRNTFRGPGLKLVDLSLGRSFNIPWFYGKEGARFQFRAEFYNLFNRVNLDPRSVASSLTDGNFSKATEVFYPRTVQLGARIEF